MKIIVVLWGWIVVTCGVLCGHGSTIKGQLPRGAQSVLRGHGVKSSFSSFPHSQGCVLCRAAGQQRRCFRPSRCFLYLLFTLTSHCLSQEEQDIAAQRFVVLLSCRKWGDYGVVVSAGAVCHTCTHIITIRNKTEIWCSWVLMIAKHMSAHFMLKVQLSLAV